MTAKKKKRRAQSPLTGLVTGLAAAATEGVVRGAARRLGVGTADAVSRDAGAGEPDRARPRDEKRRKDDKRRSKKAKKARLASRDAGVELLTELAAKARKRLAKLADKLESVTEKRHALIGELVSLQEGIAAAVRRFESGGETTVEPSSKKTRRKARRRTLTAARARRVNRDADGSIGSIDDQPGEPAALGSDDDDRG